MILTDFLETHGVHYATSDSSGKVTRGWIGLPCPFCRHIAQDGDPHLLGINIQSGRCNCWYCGPHRLGEVLARATGQPLALILKQTLPGLKYPVGLPAQKTRGKYSPPRGTGPLQPAHRRYLEQRGFDPDQLSRLWGLQGIGFELKYTWRLFIPVTNRGEFVSWTTRSIRKEETARYLSAPPENESIAHKDLLYGADLARHAIIVVEGPTDVWAIGPGAVCTFGTSYTPAQMAAIAEYPVRVVLYDNEPTAQRKADELCRNVSVLPGQTFRLYTDGKDAADLLTTPKGREDIRKIREFLQ